jgi:excinuclease ABC subunit A
MVRQSEDQILDTLLQNFKGKKLYLLAPIVKGRKGHYRELFQQIRKSGYTKVRIDGELHDITAKMQVDRYKIHDIEIVMDRIITDVKIARALANPLTNR